MRTAGPFILIGAMLATTIDAGNRNWPVVLTVNTPPLRDPNNKQALYRKVRSLTRGLALLEALAVAGWAKPSDLALRTGIDRSSVYRILSTLEEFGYVLRHTNNGTFTLTQKVRVLADGARDDEITLKQVRPHLTALTADIKWPSDLAVLSGGMVTIQDSTHRQSNMTFHRAVVQQKRSLVTSSLGRAILTVLDPQERQIALQVAALTEGPSAGRLLGAPAVQRVLDDYRQHGCAWAVGSVDPRISAIALGFRGRGGLVGAVNVIFFRRVLSPAEAAARFLPRLRECVRALADMF